jgi:serine/threonine protein kinase/uncharacterized membrane protein YhaH (DUF805 family)
MMRASFIHTMPVFLLDCLQKAPLLASIPQEHFTIIFSWSRSMPNCFSGRHPNEPGSLWCRECGSLVEGASIGEYRLLSFIGRGSSADVYLAEQPSLNRRKVVIKILPQTRLVSSVEAFQREAEALAALSHPYILPIFAYGVLYREVKRRDIEYDAKELCLPYLALPYAENGSLADIFQREGSHPWSVARVVTIAREIGEALDYAHEQGILHRDVKPANILRMGSHALLSDFSVASLIDAGVSHLNAPWAGSPAYMAPEVWQLHPGRYSDQYALAIVCYYLLTGQLPWRKTDDRTWTQLHLFEPPRPIGAARPDAPLALDLVLQRALAKDPHRRYPTAQEFAADLRVASRDITQPVVSAPPSWEQQRAFSAPDSPARGKQERRAAPAQVAPVRRAPETPRLPFASPPIAPIAPAIPGAPRPFLRMPAPLPVDPSTSPGNAPRPQAEAGRGAASAATVSTAQTESLRAVGRAKNRDWWVGQALLLNVVICLALAAGEAWQAGNMPTGERSLLALWPALAVGPLLALAFRRVTFHSLSWGLFWGTFFGLTNGLFSILLCLVWIVLVFLPLSNPCTTGCSQGGGVGALVQEASALAPQAILPLVLGLWVSVIGGGLIGIYHVREE